MVIEESLEVAVRRPRNMEPTCFPSPGKVLKNYVRSRRLSVSLKCTVKHQPQMLFSILFWCLEIQGLQVSLSWFGGQL